VIGFAVSLSRSQGENVCRQAADERTGRPPFKFTCSLAKFIAKGWALPCPLLYRVKERNIERKLPTQQSEENAGQSHGRSGIVKALPRKVEKSGWEWLSKRY